MLSVASRIRGTVIRRFCSEARDYAKHFGECDFRVGNIVSAESVETSDKLMVE